MENIQLSLVDLKHMQDAFELKAYEKHGIVEYPFSENLLALVVEIGELANELQTFKYWKNKENYVIDNEKVHEEFADCLHFALSLEDIVNISNMHVTDEQFNSVLDDPDSEVTINDLFNSVICNVTQNNQILLNVLYLGMSIGMTMNDIVIAYVKKNKINYERLENNY